MSDRTLRNTLTAIAVIGLGVASYLTVVHYTRGGLVCFLNGACETVQTSRYSELAGIPVALLGLIGYVLILVSLRLPTSETTRLATVAFTGIGFGFSVYLTYRELFSIHAICPWCVSSAVMMTLLVCLAIWRFLRGDQAGRTLSHANGDQGATPGYDAADRFAARGEEIEAPQGQLGAPVARPQGR